MHAMQLSQVFVIVCANCLQGMSLQLLTRILAQDRCQESVSDKTPTLALNAKLISAVPAKLPMLRPMPVPSSASNTIPGRRIRKSLPSWALALGALSRSNVVSNVWIVPSLYAWTAPD